MPSLLLRPPRADARENRYWIEAWTKDRGEFDQIIAREVDYVHMEIMDARRLWIRLNSGEDAQIVWIGAKRPGRLEITTQADEASEPLPPLPGTFSV